LSSDLLAYFMVTYFLLLDVSTMCTHIYDLYLKQAKWQDVIASEWVVS